MLDDARLSQLLQQRLKAQANLFAALTDHPGLIGAGREAALADLLRQFLPQRFEILAGAIAVLDGDQRPVRSTHQLDLIIADTLEYPTLLRSGNTAVVLAPAVRAVLEVKSNLRRGASFVSAMVQIARARSLLKARDSVFTGLFSFRAPTRPDTLREWISDVVALRQLLLTGQGDPSIVRIRDTMLRSDDETIRVADERELLAILANDNLPGFIAADRGAVACYVRRRNGSDFYTFVGVKQKIPSVIAMIRQLIAKLEIGADPAVRAALTTVRAHLAIDLVRAHGVDDISLSRFVPVPPTTP